MYVSLIEDTELIQGDSSDIYFLGMKDNRVLSTGWTAKYTIIEDFGKQPVIERVLPLNSGTGEGDNFPVATKFIFQITPTESGMLTANKKYVVSVQITNSSIPYNAEVAQYKIKIKPQGVV